MHLGGFCLLTLDDLGIGEMQLSCDENEVVAVWGLSWSTVQFRADSFEGCRKTFWWSFSGEEKCCASYLLD